MAELDGFTTAVPPPDGPLQPDATRSGGRRDPYAMDDMGREPWDRFQTLGGIQYYFDTEFQLLRGHMYYSGTEWALSSINQHGLWEKKPILNRDGHVSVLSVDIGDFNTPSRHLKDEFGHGKAARDCTADEIATEVWRQIVTRPHEQRRQRPRGATTVARVVRDRPRSDHGGWSRSGRRPSGSRTRPRIWFPSSGTGRIGRVPTPGTRTGTSWATIPTEDVWLNDLQQRNVWQARHGGYQVHNNSVVFAGTWTKTFTRMTSMEAACESGRHAVNAILDHYVWVESGGVDRRGETTLDWRFPYGFLDQGLSTPVRMPSPAGDYCYVFDIENREPLDTRTLRDLDARYWSDSLTAIPGHTGWFPGRRPHTPCPLTDRRPPMTSPIDYNQQLLAYLQAWRQLSSGVGCDDVRTALPAGPLGMPPRRRCRSCRPCRQPPQVHP